MKKFVLVVLAAACATALALPAGAQQRGDRGPGMRQQGPEGILTPEQFQERKAQVLKMLDQRAQRIVEEKACVDASTDMEGLRKCRPEPHRPMGPGQSGPGGMGGPGMDRPPMGGMDGPR